MEKELQKRIGYEDDIKRVLEKVCANYNLGDYKSHKIFTFGYEDFNLKLTSSKGSFFVKILATFRDMEDCKRYAFILDEISRVGVRYPRLFKVDNKTLYQLTIDRVELRLFVMEYIDGNNLFEAKIKLNEEEMKDIVRQAAKISALNIKPKFEYDSWAITSFPKEFEKDKELLEKEDLELIKPLVKEFENLSTKELPHSFVHGDIIKTNVVKSKIGELYILDFAVANYYPRIIELAVLLCDILFDQDNPENFPTYYQLALGEYQKTIKLTTQELESLPLFIKIAHAMHVIPATREMVKNKNTSEENMYWLNTGKIGLRYTSKLLN